MDLVITVNTVELTERIEKNKKRYVKSYQALMKAWKKKAEKFHKQYVEYLEAYGLDKLAITKERIKKGERLYPPQKPDDRTETYIQYLAMLKEHIEPTITLNGRSYTRLWLDEWDWTSTHIGWLQDYYDYDGNNDDISLALISYTGEPI